MSRLKKAIMLLLAVSLSVALSLPATAKEFKYSTSGDILTIDPHSQNEGPNNAMKNNVYECLVHRNWKLEVEPSLATRWEVINPTTWRFYLRKGVKFHDGRLFTADDVVFSYQRNAHPNSDMNTYVGTVQEVKKVDDYTVDYITKGPDPILTQNLTLHFIMSKSWCEENKSLTPVRGSTEEIYATRHANGTGPFKLVERVPDTRTVVVVNTDWWNHKNRTDNVTKATFVPIGNAATRVSALLTGEVDMMFPVPLQDIPRINATPGVKVLEGPELRTIFLGFDQHRDELLDLPGSKKNPFKDVRVRRAVYKAIDIEAIHKKIMRGASTPSGMMIAPGIVGWDKGLYERDPYDPEAAKKLLAEAGYPDGFPVTLDCPNDRYVNDEAICQSVVPMLARIGIKATLNAQTKGLHFDKIGLKQKNNTSLYMLGWTPGTYDGLNALVNLMTLEGKGHGTWNCGRYTNPKVEALTQQIAVETDQEKRRKMMYEAHKIHREDFGHVPLHQQALAWGVRDYVDIKQPANDSVYLRYVKINK